MHRVKEHRRTTKFGTVDVPEHNRHRTGEGLNADSITSPGREKPGRNRNLESTPRGLRLGEQVHVLNSDGVFELTRIVGIGKKGLTLQLT